MQIINGTTDCHSKLIYWQNGDVPQKNFTEEKVGITETEALRLLERKGGVAFTVYFNKGCEPLGMTIITPET